MALDRSCDEELLRRLPLPLAQLYSRAHNAKSPFDRHQAAYFLWEAALRLLASAAVITYAEHPTPDPDLDEALKKLARPAWATGGRCSAAWSRSSPRPAMRASPPSAPWSSTAPATTCP